MNILGYNAIVEPLKPELGGGYVGYIPALKGCITDGETENQAIGNLHDAAASWLEAAVEFGQPIPAKEYNRLTA
ncbi:type II toxin-antitoxin system HicB family antitoxin [Sphingomonas sp. Marseille-Q8236]